MKHALYGAAVAALLFAAPACAQSASSGTATAQPQQQQAAKDTKAADSKDQDKTQAQAQAAAPPKTRPDTGPAAIDDINGNTAADAMGGGPMQ